MKAIVNSESLFLLAKLVKNGSYEISVKNGRVKLLAESSLGEYQVEIIEPNNSNNEDGVLSIPRQVFSLLPRKTSLIMENNVIKSKDQEIQLSDEGSKPIEEVQMEKGRCIDITNFSELIEVIYAVAKDNFRPTIQCIYIDKCNFVALDGYRMSVRSNIEDITDKPMLIPSHIVGLLKNFTKSDIATVYENNEYMKICFGWISITAKNTKDKNGDDLKFISYESLLPKEHKTKVIVKASELGTICKQMVKVDRGYSGLIKIKFNVDSAYISAKNQGLNIRRYIGAEVEGEELEIGVNPKYMLEALKNYTANVTLYMSNAVSPILITDEKNKKDLVLPIRLMR